MEDLEVLVNSQEFTIVKTATEALDPMLLVDPRVGAHLLAFRTGMQRLAEVDFTPPEEPEPGEAPGEDEGEGGNGDEGEPDAPGGDD